MWQSWTANFNTVHRLRLYTVLLIGHRLRWTNTRCNQCILTNLHRIRIEIFVLHSVYDRWFQSATCNSSSNEVINYIIRINYWSRIDYKNQYKNQFILFQRYQITTIPQQLSKWNIRQSNNCLFIPLMMSTGSL